MNELEKEIKKKIQEIQTTNPDYYGLSDKKLRELINEGARIQQELDSIVFIQETYCIDNFEEARAMLKVVLEDKRLKDSHIKNNETIPVKDCGCMACINQKIYDDRMKSFKESAEKAAGRWG